MYEPIPNLTAGTRDDLLRTNATRTYGRLHAQAQVHAVRHRPGGCDTGGHLIHTDGYVGGASTSTPPGVPFTPKKYCAFQQKGTHPVSKNSSSVTFVKNLGIVTGDGLEFQASIQTGFDSSAQLTYKYLYNGTLCGQKSVPGGHPRQLVVHSGTY
jgi:hypothetical protein